MISASNSSARESKLGHVLTESEKRKLKNVAAILAEERLRTNELLTHNLVEHIKLRKALDNLEQAFKDVAELIAEEIRTN